ncbi:MAG: lipopolysaccharide biosynthesis protein [Aphanocapsa lilacina HA4352-LM1]|jgi:PST family polysaccharide transporter|nr:lipopolysaccharide biosynthesis protein [Aphanocapsa lilacina HA4352-LM1]
MNLRHKAITGVGWSAVQNFGSQFLSLWVYLVLARILGPETFGLVALASVFVAFVQVFQEQGFTEAIVQRPALDRAHLDTAFWTNATIGLVLTLFGIAVSGPVAALFGEPRLGAILAWLAPSLLIGSLSAVQQAVLTREFAFRTLAARQLVATLAGGAVGLAMALSGFGVWSLVAQQLANQAIGLAILWFASPWRPGLQISKAHLRELFGFGINVTGFNLSNFFNRRAVDFLIGYFLGPVALGYYSIAMRILTVMIQLLTTTTTQVAMPTFSQLQQQPERLRSAFYTVTQFTSLVSFPAFLGVAALAPELVTVVFGSQWQASVPVLQILALLGLQQSVLFFNSTVLVAMGKPAWRLGINLLNAVCGLVAFAFAVHWGIVAVAAAYTLRVYLLSPVTIWAVDRLIRIELVTYLNQFIPPLIGSLAMVSAIWATRQLLLERLDPLSLLAFCLAVGAGVYLLTLRWCAPALFERAFSYVRLLLPKAAGGKIS